MGHRRFPRRAHRGRARTWKRRDAPRFSRPRAGPSPIGETDVRLHPSPPRLPRGKGGGGRVRLDPRRRHRGTNHRHRRARAGFVPCRARPRGPRPSARAARACDTPRGPSRACRDARPRPPRRGVWLWRGDSRFGRATRDKRVSRNIRTRFFFAPANVGAIRSSHQSRAVRLRLRATPTPLMSSSRRTSPGRTPPPTTCWSCTRSAGTAWWTRPRPPARAR